MGQAMGGIYWGELLGFRGKLLGKLLGEAIGRSY